MTDNKAVMQQALARLIWWESTYGEPTETEDPLHLSLRQAIVQPVQQTELQQQNQQLRDQNAALDARCAEYERTAQTNLQALVHKVHAAKGRHHSQIAMCDLYDACGLTNARPGVETKETK